MLSKLTALVEKIKDECEDQNALDVEDMAYLEEIKDTGDILNYTEDGSGKMTSLAASAAKALGQTPEWITVWIDNPYYGVVEQAQSTVESTSGFGHSGLGVGGLATHVEELPIPSAAAVERVQAMEAEMETCHRCGQNDLFDGAMFTTMAGSGYCDDCC